MRTFISLILTLTETKKKSFGTSVRERVKYIRQSNRRPSK